MWIDAVDVYSVFDEVVYRALWIQLWMIIRLEIKIQAGMEQLKRINYRVFVEIEPKIRWQGV